MRFFVKAIATGFAMSLGSAIFKKVSDKMGLEGENAEKGPGQQAKATDADGDTGGGTGGDGSEPHPR